MIVRVSKSPFRGYKAGHGNFSITRGIRVFDPPALKSNPFIDLRSVTADIQVEMRYFGSDKFVGAPVADYQANRCLLVPEAAPAQASVQRRLQCFQHFLVFSFVDQGCFSGFRVDASAHSKAVICRAAGWLVWFCWFLRAANPGCNIL
ncbi:MAG: M15 family metallopeptidase [Exilibacterium sp.]